MIINNNKFVLINVLIIITAVTTFDKTFFLLSSTYIMVILLSVLIVNGVFKRSEELLYIKYREVPTLTFIFIILALLLVQLSYTRFQQLNIEFMKYFVIGLLTILVFKFLFVDNKKIVLFCKILIFSGFFISLFTLISHFLYLSVGIDTDFIRVFRSYNIPRGVGLYENPNYYALTHVLTVGIILGLSKLNQIKLNKFYLMIILVVSSDLILTFSRGALIALVAIFFLYLISNISQNKYTIKNLLYIVTTMLIVILVFYVLGPEFLQTIFYTQFLERLVDGFTRGSGRYDLWINGWYLYTNSIIHVVLGVGGNNFHMFSEYGITEAVHNSYLRYLYEMGIIGFLSMVTYIIYLIKRTVGRFFEILSPFFFPLIGVLIFAITNDIIYIYEFWILVACIIYWK
ncbi:O-antigen ligase family protein [Evansella sp. AB-P1]|uniref:O-antigen ligase family protein n=1 Tax=Evansella sp. AB-P1 TaxID=3037653 RepID=UPI00241FCEEB|nr:O-antigen ligase family protein [Evansella sp. AB-P1]MDG5789304.1 O-antigen ligase family protein [Evansella sp. AB-P1]